MEAENKTSQPVLEVKNLGRKYHLRPEGLGLAPWKAQNLSFWAVKDVNFSIYPGETLGILGESGSGKSTLSRLILDLIPATTGTCLWNGKIKSPGPFDVQMVFQDSFSSLNPKMTIAEILQEPLKIVRGEENLERVFTLLHWVGLPRKMANRYPHECSGGQRQRLGLARVLMLDPPPQLLIADEPVSALDLSIQAQILNLITQLQKSFGFACLFIAHDAAVVAYMSHKVAVMYMGVFVEWAPTRELYEKPLHPYSQALIASLPEINPSEKTPKFLAQGEPPSPSSPPKGCAFHPRCFKAQQVCRHETPQLLKQKHSERYVACHFPQN